MTYHRNNWADIGCGIYFYGLISWVVIRLVIGKFISNDNAADAATWFILITLLIGWFLFYFIIEYFRTKKLANRIKNLALPKLKHIDDNYFNNIVTGLTKDYQQLKEKISEDCEIKTWKRDSFV